MSEILLYFVITVIYCGLIGLICFAEEDGETQAHLRSGRSRKEEEG